jgi:UDP-glucuronate 4-epimerase
LDRRAVLNIMPTQDGEMTRTEADISETRAALGYERVTPIDVGVKRFVDGCRDVHGVRDAKRAGPSPVPPFP